MNSDSATTTPTSSPTELTVLTNDHSQIHLKTEGNELILTLPTGNEAAISDSSKLIQELKCRLNGSEKTWPSGTLVHLVTKDRLLDIRKLQTIANTLDEFNLKLHLVSTSRRQTAVAAATLGCSVRQESFNNSIISEIQDKSQELAEPLYLQTTVRSGIEIRHPGTVFIWGDLNPGGAVIAAGDILIWGRLRGIAHAGAQGNREAHILALIMQPTQLRIADTVARVPQTLNSSSQPEIAYISPTGINLTVGIDFFKRHAFCQKIAAWKNCQNQELIHNK